jgi:hypothetical protein
MQRKEDKKKEYQDAISGLEVEIAGIEEDGKAMESALAAILDDMASTRQQLEGFNKRKLKFAKDNEYWKAYGAVLAAMPVNADIQGEEMGGFREKLIAFNTHVQKLANEAKGPLVAEKDQKVVDETTLDKTLNNRLNAINKALANADETYAEARARGKHATVDVPLVVVGERMTVIDESRVQYIPMWRSMVGTVVDEITMQNGLVATHSINEPSEVLGVVKIPLKVVEATLGTVQSLWTKQKSAIEAEAAVLTAEAQLIDSRAKLEEARNKKE